MVDYRNYANLGNQGGGLLGGILNARSAQGQQQIRQDALDRQNQQDLIGGLRYGINTQRLNEPEYVQQVAEQQLNRVSRPLGSSEFERLLSQSDLSDEEKNELLQGRLGNISKSPEVLYNQAFSQAQGKGQGTLPTARNIEFEKGAGKLEAEQRFKPQIEQEISRSKALGKESVERGSIGREAVRGVEDIRVAGQNINRILDENPELAGGYSPARAAASRYGLIGGFDEKQQEAKGELTRNLSSLQNKALALATQAGQSGINIQAEVDRITQGLQPTSTPAEIRGAIKSMQETQDRLARQLGGNPQSITAQQDSIINDNDPLGLR